jgi:hypothetical protein
MATFPEHLMPYPLLRALVVVALSVCMTLPALAGDRRTGAGTLTPDDRGALARDFVMKWGGYVQRVYGTPVGAWSKRMVSTFVAADPSNFRNALKRETFEGAVAELTGTGHRVSDNLVIERFARASLSGKSAAAPGAKALGSTTGDLVFTPVQPCRVADTRVAGGAIAADGSRSFLAVAISAGTGFAFQGGSSTDCGVGAVGASAVALNVTAVTPSIAGYATVYPHGSSRPLAASVNYTAGAIVNNTVIVRIPNPLTTNDFTIYSFGQSHYVVDIVGYFSPPQATRLQCSDTAISTFTVAANTATFINNPACPTGYDAITPYCYTNASGVYSRGSGYNSNTNGLATFCAWQNTTASTQQVFGGNVCCRIPGR